MNLKQTGPPTIHFAYSNLSSRTRLYLNGLSEEGERHVPGASPSPASREVLINALSARKVDASHWMTKLEGSTDGKATMNFATDGFAMGTAKIGADIPEAIAGLW